MLGSVVTDAPLVPTRRGAAAAHAEGCGSCSRCLTACPTGALVAPGVLDARRCLAWLVQAPGSFPEEYRQALGDRIYGCDECQQVCPINRVADRRTRRRPHRQLLTAAATAISVVVPDHRWLPGGPPRPPGGSDDELMAGARPLVHRRP